MMLCLPQLPHFKNFSLEKLKTYNKETLASKVIRFTGQIVRREEYSNRVDGVFDTYIGLQIADIGNIEQKMILDYVDTFTANIVNIIVLLDNLNNDLENIEKLRLICEFLGYNKNEKISILRQILERDYLNLQWV